MRFGSLRDIGWLMHEADPTNGRRVILVKCRIDGESGRIMGIYDQSYSKDIIPEKRLKE
ncbi:MAG: hypothetical protein WBA22_14440 [Candidatus Methanofastidiosia archaeon]